MHRKGMDNYWQVIIGKYNLSDQIKWEFIHTVAVSVLLHSCTTDILTKWLEEKQNGNYIRMLHAVLNKSCKQHPKKRQLYSHLPPISQTIQVRWTRHVGHCWGSKNKFISYVLQWTSTHEHTSVGQLAKTYIHQLCMDTGCCRNDLLRAHWESLLQMKSLIFLEN